ncbi:GNAT family N-acetyltransferase [Spirosoma endbachense]|uniref:GNAT family N-acetyltransferase n=1 Tax=Spirosoma endbachense TaxID=2666025 RepID=A0A6P1VTJ3_9BACT|nr:GNAT family protein [Spirosoma endbachense]QHV96551.1 GNAT family N-acetyltransferase [Spirosoma endbachense]
MRPEILAGPVVLRKYEPGFIPLLFEAARASCSPLFTRYARWCHPDYAVADSEQFIAQCERDWQDGTAFNFALLDARTSELCGGIGLNQPNRVHGFYNLGYWVRPSRQGQGLASQATRQLALAAFADLAELNRLEILVVPDNLASQRTALAAGATREGLLRQRLLVGIDLQDAILFSLIRADIA